MPCCVSLCVDADLLWFLLLCLFTYVSMYVCMCCPAVESTWILFNSTRNTRTCCVYVCVQACLCIKTTVALASLGIYLCMYVFIQTNSHTYMYISCKMSTLSHSGAECLIINWCLIVRLRVCIQFLIFNEQLLFLFHYFWIEHTSNKLWPTVCVCVCRVVVASLATYNTQLYLLLFL